MKDAVEADYVEDEEDGQKYEFDNMEEAFDQNMDDDDVLNMKDADEADYLKDEEWSNDWMTQWLDDWMTE